MAKGKHSTALFEVIRKDRPLTQQKDRGILGSLIGQPAPAETLPPAVEEPPVQAEAESPHREMLIRLSYPTAVVAGLALATLIGGAFLAGQKSGRGVRPAISAQFGDEVRRLDPQPDVVNVARVFDRAATAEPPENTATVVPGRIGATDPGLAARGRLNGANYIIIQSYPEQEHKMAEEAVKFLRENGIEATLEKDLPRWGLAGWYTVLGTTGFEKISSQQCEAYTKKVREISDRYARKGSFKAFDPKPYRWGKASGS